MKIRFSILIFLTLSLTMKSQDDNPKAAVFYIDKSIYLIYYSNEHKFLYSNNRKQKWYTDYEELKKYLAKNDGLGLKPDLRDYFDYQLTNYNFFIGQNKDNIDDLYEKNVKYFEKEYNMSFSNKDEINTLFKEKIKNCTEEELKYFLSKAEIPLLQYSGNYLITNNKSDYKLYWSTSKESNIFNEEYLIKSLFFNEKKFNIIERIRYYFSEILNRHKYLKKGTKFDIDTMLNFVESSILINISSRYPISPLSENYKKNMVEDD